MGDTSLAAWPNDLLDFVRLCQAGNLARCSAPAAQPNATPPRTLPGPLRRGCKPKKLHEVAWLTHAVALAAESVGAATVVDFGSGAGYLGSVLAADAGLQVVGVECEAHLNAKAERRAADAVRWAVKRQGREARQTLANEDGSSGDATAIAHSSAAAALATSAPLSGSVAAVTALVGSGEDLDAVVSGCQGAVLTGLHTCGDLHASLLRIFIESSARALVSVGCCYHRRTELGGAEEVPRVYPLSRHIAALDVPLSQDVGVARPMVASVEKRAAIIRSDPIILAALQELEMACHTAEDFAARSASSLWAYTHRAMLQLLLRQRLSAERCACLVGGLRELRHS